MVNQTVKAKKSNKSSKLSKILKFMKNLRFLRQRKRVLIRNLPLKDRHLRVLKKYLHKRYLQRNRSQTSMKIMFSNSMKKNKKNKREKLRMTKWRQMIGTNKMNGPNRKKFRKEYKYGIQVGIINRKRIMIAIKMSTKT